MRLLTVGELFDFRWIRKLEEHYPAWVVLMKMLLDYDEDLEFVDEQRTQPPATEDAALLIGHRTIKQRRRFNV